MANYRSDGRPLTSIDEVRSAARDGLLLNVGGDLIPAQNLYHTSLRFLVDQLEHGAVTWCDPAEDLAALNARWDALRADIVAAALRAADRKDA